VRATHTTLPQPQPKQLQPLGDVIQINPPLGTESLGDNINKEFYA